MGKRRSFLVPLAVTLLLGLVVGGRLYYLHRTVEIPAQTLLVYWGSERVAANFPQTKRIWKSDKRLQNTEQIPYWSWSYIVERHPTYTRYAVSLSIMGTPEEGLRYRRKSKANWQRRQLEAWAHQMLDEFEQETAPIWMSYQGEWTPERCEEFQKTLLDWFQKSRWANQGIRITGASANFIG